MILALSIILFTLLVVINRKRGIKAFVSLYLNFIFVVIAIILITWGFNPVMIALIFSLTTSAFILFFINGFNVKTKVAYISVIIVLIIISMLIIFISYKSDMHGFTMEHSSFLFAFPQNIYINYIHVAMAVIIMGLTGAITDTALDLATSLNEVYENNPNLSFNELLKSGRNMGSDVLGTMINTLFFVFIGEFMGFFFLYQQFDLKFIINNKLFMEEISELFIGALGCTLIIPTVIIVQSYIYTKNAFK